MKKVILLIIIAIFLTSCMEKQTGLSKSGLDLSKFETTVAGKENRLHVLKNANGMEVCIINFGARIVSILVPDRDRKFRDVVLGFDNISDYLNNKTDFGAAIGRYGNRIAKGKFSLNGTDYQLTVNNGENSLHGGTVGFQYKYFDIRNLDAQTLECTYLSTDGDNGYPGNLNVKVIYRLRDDNALEIDYEATTDKSTVVNLTNHSYFNLSGNSANSISDHILYLNADRFTVVDTAMIPTGEIAGVENTALDFTVPAEIGKRIDEDCPQLKLAKGYDHNWIFKSSNTIDSTACKLVCPASGIAVEVFTTEPAVQFYTGNFLDGTLTGKKNIVYQKRSGLCLETQHYPDSPNHPDFPSTVLNPGEKYKSKTIYKFSTD